VASINLRPSVLAGRSEGAPLEGARVPAGRAPPPGSCMGAALRVQSCRKKWAPSKFGRVLPTNSGSIETRRQQDSNIETAASRLEHQDARFSRRLEQWAAAEWPRLVAASRC